MPKLTRYLLLAGLTVDGLAALSFAALFGACAADRSLWTPPVVLLAIALATAFMVGSCLALTGVIILAVRRWNDAFTEGVLSAIDSTVGRLVDALPNRNNVRVLHPPHDRTRP